MSPNERWSHWLDMSRVSTFLHYTVSQKQLFFSKLGAYVKSLETSMAGLRMAEAFSLLQEKQATNEETYHIYHSGAASRLERLFDT
jgi:hypothetical protein